METRFLRGGDKDFNYDTVDDINPDYDNRVTKELYAEDRYFEAGEPEFVDDHERETKRKVSKTSDHLRYLCVRVEALKLDTTPLT